LCSYKNLTPMKYILTSKKELQKIIRKEVEELLVNEMKKQPEAEPKHPLDDYLNASEAAKFLRISITTLYGMSSKRQVAFKKQGKKLYFSREDLLKWLEQNNCENLPFNAEPLANEETSNDRKDQSCL